MTNNPTIDGVSRALIENAANYMEGSASAQVNIWCRELRAILDAPAVERQPSAFLYETAMKCTENSESRVYSGFLPSLGISLPSVPEDSLRNIRPLYEVAPEVTALQSTIVQLQARLQELESGSGEPVAVITSVVSRRSKRFEIEILDNQKLHIGTWLFTAPPAPVEVVLPERKEIIPGRESNREDSGWNACLDATAALNGEQK